MRKQFIVAGTILASLLVTATGARASQFDSGVSPSDAKQIYSYTLNMDQVQKMAAATRALSQLGKSHPEINQVREARSIDAMLQNLQRSPEAVAAINRSGLTPREYVLCLMTVMQASMAVGFKKSGAFTQYPPELLQQISRANLDFTEQHFDEIQKLMPGER
jgi:hypothetical protein